MLEKLLYIMLRFQSLSIPFRLTWTYHSECKMRFRFSSQMC